MENCHKMFTQWWKAIIIRKRKRKGGAHMARVTKEMTMGELLHLQMLHMFTELIQIFLLRNWMQQLMQNLVSNIRFAEQQKIEQ